jgi:hypothetical protein
MMKHKEMRNIKAKQSNMTCRNRRVIIRMVEVQEDGRTYRSNEAFEKIMTISCTELNIKFSGQKVSKGYQRGYINW